MAMDLSSIKNRLENLNSKGKKKTYEKIDYTTVFFKPKAEKYQIRFVPSKFNKENPFKEVYFHYGIGKFPLLALTNFDEKDPIVDFCDSLKKSTEKENWQLAGKLSPKLRVFAPVIVRGEEEKGVRLWEFGTLVYKQLLGIADDADYGDFTDVLEGRDFTLEGTDGEVGGRKAVTCAIRIKPKTSALSDDATQVEKWLNEQPNILEIRKKHTYAELKDALAKWLNPEAAKPEEAEASDEPVKIVSKPVTTVTQKKSPTDKFSAIFNS